MIELRADTPLRLYVHAGALLRKAAESPAETAMAEVLLWASASFVYLQSNGNGPQYSVFIVPQQEVADGKYRVDWLVTIGTRCFALEVDGFAYHSDQAAFQRDRQRDRDLAAIGFETVRFAAKEILAHPEQVKRELLLVFIRESKAAVPTEDDR